LSRRVPFPSAVWAVQQSEVDTAADTGVACSRETQSASTLGAAVRSDVVDVGPASRSNAGVPSAIVKTESSSSSWKPPGGTQRRMTEGDVISERARILVEAAWEALKALLMSLVTTNQGSTGPNSSLAIPHAGKAMNTGSGDTSIPSSALPPFDFVLLNITVTKFQPIPTRTLDDVFLPSSKLAAVPPSTIVSSSVQPMLISVPDTAPDRRDAAALKMSSTSQAALSSGVKPMVANSGRRTAKLESAQSLPVNKKRRSSVDLQQRLKFPSRPSTSSNLIRSSSADGSLATSRAVIDVSESDFDQQRSDRLPRAHSGLSDDCMDIDASIDDFFGVV